MSARKAPLVRVEVSSDEVPAEDLDHIKRDLMIDSVLGSNLRRMAVDLRHLCGPAVDNERDMRTCTRVVALLRGWLDAQGLLSTSGDAPS